MGAVLLWPDRDLYAMLTEAAVTAAERYMRREVADGLEAERELVNAVASHIHRR